MAYRQPTSTARPARQIRRFIAALCTIAGASAHAQIATEPSPFESDDPNAVVPGELFIEPPTLINLGFEWLIQGDENRNASVTVSFREQGAGDWRPGLPLLRLNGERIYSESRVDVIVPNMFAGSREFHVYPHRFTGEKIEPAFEGLMCAYNQCCAGTDWATSGRPRVRPGDRIVVHAGVYRYNRYEYTNNATVNRTTPLDGTYCLTADDTPERPIAIVAAGDGEVVFDGNGNYALFDVRAAD